MRTGTPSDSFIRGGHRGGRRRRALDANEEMSRLSVAEPARLLQQSPGFTGSCGGLGCGQAAREALRCFLRTFLKMRHCAKGPQKRDSENRKCILHVVQTGEASRRVLRAALFLSQASELKCVALGGFEEETKCLHFTLRHLSRFLPLTSSPVSYGSLCTQTRIPRPPFAALLCVTFPTVGEPGCLHCALCIHPFPV